MKRFVLSLAVFLIGLTTNANAYWRLTWADNSDNETAFAVERKEGAGTYAEVGQVATNVVTFNDLTSIASVAYCYRIKAVNQHGANAGPEVCGMAGSRAPGMPQLQWIP